MGRQRCGRQPIACDPGKGNQAVAFELRAVGSIDFRIGFGVAWDKEDPKSGSSGALLPRRPLRTGRADHFAPGSSHSPAPRCDTGLPGGMFRVLTVGEVGIPCGIERVRQRRDFGVPLD